MRGFGVDVACPECGTAPQDVAAGPTSRFRCRTGHVYSPLSLVGTKTSELEADLSAAMRALEEEASIAGRLAARANEVGAAAVARLFEMRRGDAARRADLVRLAIARRRDRRRQRALPE
jgi:two-component system chemotaxis response regulator CheB